MSGTSSLVRTALLSLALAAPLPAVAQNSERAAENFRQADADGDGHLVYAEFASFIDLNAEDGIGNAQRVSTRGLHARAFERIDANGDGIVSPAELQAVR
ncbi:MAG: RNA polymerase subunit sigma-70 [Pseudomonadota bacterium]